MTAFQSAEVLAAFTVTGVVDSVDLTWTVTHGGATSTATARAALNLPCTEAPPPDPDVPIGLFVTCVVNHGATCSAAPGRHRLTSWGAARVRAAS